MPDIDTLGLESASIEYDKKEGIKVNEFMQCFKSCCLCCSRCSRGTGGGAQLTPVAIYDGKIVASNLINGNHTKPNYIGVPSVVFTLPPLASVGLQESVAKKRGMHFKTKSEKNTSGWYTSRRIGERYSGFKVLVEQRQGNTASTNIDDNSGSKDGRVLGAYLLGMHAEEIINIFALAIRLGLYTADIEDGILSYSTKSYDIGYML